MKIAIITDDEQNVSMHFGRARAYVVFTLEEGKIVKKEVREKMGHQHFSQNDSTATSGQGEGHHGHGEHNHRNHGHNEHDHSKHALMFNPIMDCNLVICGGMGRGAYEFMQSMGVQPLVTDIRPIEKVIQAYLDGKLVDHPEALH